MDKTYVRVIFQPGLKNPVVVASFPGVGGVGVTTARLLIDFLGAKLFAELYSPFLPDYTPVSPDGLCSLLKYDFYASIERNIVVLIGEEQPPPDDIPAYYDICGEILDFMENINCAIIFTVDGIPTIYPQRTVYVAGTSKRIILECVDMGAKVYADGRIIGLSGLLLGLAKLRGIDGACILTSVTDLISDKAAAFDAYNFLRRILGLGLEKTIWG